MLLGSNAKSLEIYFSLTSEFISVGQFLRVNYMTISLKQDLLIHMMKEEPIILL